MHARITGSMALAVWWGVLSVALIFGGILALRGVVFGIGGFNTDDVVFWGMPMAGYLFFVLTAAGLTLLSSLPSVFGLHRYYAIAKRAGVLALATLMVGLMCKGLDLGPWSTLMNLPWVVLSPNLSSPILWMAMLYGGYIAFVVLKVALVHKGRWHSHGGKEVAVLVLLLSGLSFVALSIVFGSVEARPGYFGPYLGLYFMATALLSGCAAILLAEQVNGFLSSRGRGAEHELLLEEITRLVRVLLLLVLFMSASRYFVALVSPGARQSANGRGTVLGSRAPLAGAARFAA